MKLSLTLPAPLVARYADEDYPSWPSHYRFWWAVYDFRWAEYCARYDFKTGVLRP